MIQLSQQISISELANTQGLVARANYVVMPYYNACFWNLQVAALDPIDHVQSRSRTKCVDWLAKFEGIAAIHVHPCSMSRVTPFNNSTRGNIGEAGFPVIRFQERPCPPSPGVPEAECPYCEWELSFPCLF